MAQKLVIDSSVIVKWLSNENERGLEKADDVLSDCQKGKVTLYAPELAKYEIGNALLRKKLNLAQVKEVIQSLYILPITFIPLSKKSASITIEISQVCDMTFYDATFLSLALELGAALVTDNPKHQSKYKKVKVIPLSIYTLK